MARLSVRPFTSSDIPAAAILLRDRHRRDASRIPAPSTALLDLPAAEEAVRALQRNPHVAGRAAERDGLVVGFMLAYRLMPSPLDFDAQFVPPHSISVPVEGHALAAGEDATEVYRALYASLAAEWVAAGFFVHRWAIPAGDAEVQEALVSLGFGRYLTAAVRSTHLPVEPAGNPAVEAREATPEDLEVVLRLATALSEHHARAPIFWPLLSTTDAAVREFTVNMLAPGQPPAWLGYAGGRPVALQSFMAPGFTPPIVDQRANVYLFEGIVEPEAQLGGVGAALLAQTMAWARAAGYETCTLHWASPNYSGAPFWLKHGFVPVEHGMERRLDERIAWARPRE